MYPEELHAINAESSPEIDLEHISVPLQMKNGGADSPDALIEAIIVKSGAFWEIRVDAFNYLSDATTYLHNSF
ncbi:hypothetical protein [Pedobacter sp.]|uniref:hypothetical protein n=1 Tax=Pedobacter sp. TaxID=1411316 RepID=UPI003D7F259F